MKNENPDGEKDRVNGEGDDSRCSPKTQRESGRKCESTFAAVEKDSQCPGQHHAEKRDHPDENAEHAGLERGTNGLSPVQRASRRGLPRLRRGKPRLYSNRRRKLVRRAI